MIHLKLFKILVLLGAMVFLTSALAKEKFPEATKDGLKLQDHSSHGALYLKEGASLADFTKIKILDCFVQFPCQVMIRITLNDFLQKNIGLFVFPQV